MCVFVYFVYLVFLNVFNFWALSGPRARVPSSILLANKTGLGFLLGGVPGGILSFFAPKIGEGITGLINRFRPAPTVTPMNLNDYTDAGSTTGFGQDISSGDLSSIGDTGFSEYSDPGTAAEYEGSF